MSEVQKGARTFERPQLGLNRRGGRDVVTRLVEHDLHTAAEHKRFPATGALIASLPLVSVIGMIWLWRDEPDAQNMAAHAGATFWYVLPSLPMCLLIPALLRREIGFWQSLIAGCLLTMLLYALMAWAGPRFGLKL